MRALLGVADRTGLVEFAHGLRECDVDIVATDGTRRALHEAGIEATAVSDVTGFPEMLDGRVKTLHPAIHAGILARRDLPEHMAKLAEHGFTAIDIVVITLYPFVETVARGADRATTIENIDIGGPTMIRAASKNSASVAVVIEPSQYDELLAELREHREISQPTRDRLAARAFAHTAAYDTAVAAYLAAELDDRESTAPEYTIGGRLIAELRYGENPHQRGALYATPGAPGGLAHARQLQGSALSFTNWLDVDAARRLVCDFSEPAAAIIKHTNPCGFAVGSDAADAYRRAFECDPRSAFGGIVALNRPLDEATAEELAKTFLEAVIVPAITPQAEARLARKERLRVLVVERPSCAAQLDVRSVDGGLLVQTVDHVSTDRAAMSVPTQRQPDEAQWRDLLVAWTVCRHVKSNAIVIVSDGMAVGVGAGQMSRVEAAELAVHRAGDRASGAVAASDAFFPMPDGVETLGKAGIAAVIQPGGSKKDPEVTAAADALSMAMVHAGARHFRH
ncbi:MAG: bifunctional phosphoribosylaminoimidazolecarboxamide formyltransferase/IMP cyclohydrolase [Candidatus Dormibacteraeota bacterium]|uniref:Bifunctional purine biosynthesis protein PurH n=1 Tax=Candidatus Aeolococcus gillhamiae TaxID=3127015 RepID=A0A2W5Z165_9BACT|nr:bifunctional phosphoribosylaminoimidazolecarboxamide formyltransferase/IMP cyclohydrolase [Candidatus Dormibacteraeota bacterium]PZR79043.1 MAG: bifunctional phosphoribosylaminoimidazolecarboxamide formyltransferase/inosine monophosphate cyclohydrolase [Candidatus Dormibacter sp. RRmetagenome_bin12]